MQQAILLDADIDEGAEIDHVAHRAFHVHTGSQVFHLKHIAAQDGRRGILARVTPRVVADQQQVEPERWFMGGKWSSHRCRWQRSQASHLARRVPLPGAWGSGSLFIEDLRDRAEFLDAPCGQQESQHATPRLHGAPDVQAEGPPVPQA